MDLFTAIITSLNFILLDIVLLTYTPLFQKKKRPNIVYRPGTPVILDDEERSSKNRILDNSEIRESKIEQERIQQSRGQTNANEFFERFT